MPHQVIGHVPYGTLTMVYSLWSTHQVIGHVPRRHTREVSHGQYTVAQVLRVQGCINVAFNNYAEQQDGFAAVRARVGIQLHHACYNALYVLIVRYVSSTTRSVHCVLNALSHNTD